jgi:3-methyl-2-oxobutanoate hydroxymethyltransferase
MTQYQKNRLTVPDWRLAKASGRKITMVTAYEFTAAALVERSPVEAILVGDSLGMVMLGYSGTAGVTMDEVLHHLRPVVKGAPHTFIIADMPFGSYNVSIADAIRNANALIQAGADAVKLEGGQMMAETVQAMTRAGIPVMGHIGLTPQTATSLGGWKVQGREAAAARELIASARELQAAGAFAIVLELVPSLLATYISAQLTIPTIGIGAGNGCDGQVLVWHDMFGLYDRIQPRFVKRYADAGQSILEGLHAYCRDVQSGAFPGMEHSFRMKPDELEQAIQAEQVLV